MAAPGKRPGVPQHEPQKREPTATERLAAIKAHEFANNGLLVPMPAEITRQSVLAWLRAIAEIGGPGHVEIAWHRVQDGYIKNDLRNQYEQICIEAGRRYLPLVERAAAEQAAERAAYLERTAKADKARRIARLEAEVAALKAG